MDIPQDWLSYVKMRAIVCHWTAGAWRASALDKEHYHLLVEVDGNLIRGDHPISDNVNTKDDNYAAHTRAFNTGTIGISVCCMAGAVEKPFHSGTYPMGEIQWLGMAQVAAELSHFYNIPVDSTHILQHGEVQKNLGIRQNGKWDCMVLPWNQALKPYEAADAFRSKVRSYL